MALTIIIINFRTAGLTAGCLRSLAAVLSEVPKMRVVVLDNASNDDSPEILGRLIDQHGWKCWVRLVRSTRNLGFAGGNNHVWGALDDCERAADYVLLLNSDTVALPGALGYCCRVMDADRSIGMMSCRLLNADGSTQVVTRRLPKPLSLTVCALGLPWRWPRLFGWANVNETPEALLSVKGDWDWIGGAFMFIRRSALERVGGMDEGFFFYGEDIEFCHRFRRAGYRVHYDPTVAITHLGGSSSDPARVAAKTRSIYTWQARYLVQRKCFGRLAAWWIHGVDIVAFVLRKVRLLAAGQAGSAKYREVSDVLAVLLRPLRP